MAEYMCFFMVNNTFKAILCLRLQEQSGVLLVQAFARAYWS
ncbi:MAG: hypothetical protein NTX79_06615 [Candidatus Micrarchaeota archaeon]|nr:hypothetical protein [Candidatus Micrarchaeota archaeon]